MKEEGEGIGEIGAACVNDTVGEVGEIDRSVDEGETQGNKGVDGARDEAVCQNQHYYFLYSMYFDHHYSIIFICAGFLRIISGLPLYSFIKPVTCTFLLR